MYEPFEMISRSINLRSFFLFFFIILRIQRMCYKVLLDWYWKSTDKQRINLLKNLTYSVGIQLIGKFKKKLTGTNIKKERLK